MKPITVAKLKDQIGMIGSRPFLFCIKCGNRASANVGDYWNHPKDFVFRCCHANMLLVKEHTMLEEVES